VEEARIPTHDTSDKPNKNYLNNHNYTHNEKVTAHIHGHNQIYTENLAPQLNSYIKDAHINAQTTNVLPNPLDRFIHPDSRGLQIIDTKRDNPAHRVGHATI
jgi:hypothetical protein